MAEKCGTCKLSTEHVSIGGRNYCASCGEPRPLTSHNARSMQDLGTRTRAVSIRPSTALHQRVSVAKGGVLDLRSAKAEVPRITPSRRPARVSKPSTQIAPASASVAPAPAPIERSHHISRFPKLVQPAQPKKTKEAIKQVAMPAHAETHHRAMSKLAAQSHTRTNHPHPVGLSRYAAVAAAVVIMGGYVWLQNYPKLELHSASSKAGFALSLPTFLPSSYSLNGPVQASNGVATLSFRSPSAAEPLKITQKITTWDSSSLRDNVVASKGTDVTSVQGQGLTIYFWGKQEAAWVNHGIWYGIEGASNLSREQILKIAYSL